MAVKRKAEEPPKKQPSKMCWVVGGPGRGSLIVHSGGKGILVRFGSTSPVGRLPEEVEPFLPTCAPDLNSLVEEGLLKECHRLHEDDFRVLQKAFPDFTAAVHFCVSKGQWVVHTAHGSMLYPQLLVKEFELHVFEGLPFQPKGFLITRYGNIKLDGEAKREKATLAFDKANNQFIVTTPDGVKSPYTGGSNIVFTSDSRAVLT